MGTSQRKSTRKPSESHRQLQSWTEHQIKWPHQTQCSFAKPANNGLVDILVGIDNAELLHSHVGLRGKSGGPIARQWTTWVELHWCA